MAEYSSVIEVWFLADDQEQADELTQSYSELIFGQEEVIAIQGEKAEEQ